MTIKHLQSYALNICPNEYAEIVLLLTTSLKFPTLSQKVKSYSYFTTLSLLENV